jgi:hypothetical protein
MQSIDEKGNQTNPQVIPKKLMMAPMTELGWLLCLNPRFLNPDWDSTSSQSILGLDAAFLENL